MPEAVYLHEFPWLRNRETLERLISAKFKINIFLSYEWMLYTEMIHLVDFVGHKYKQI